jgi:hypothetical protein
MAFNCRIGGIMSTVTAIAVKDFREAFFILLDEIFTGGGDQDFVLDSGTSLVETLRGISAEEASIPVSARTASLAAEVNHILVYLDAILTPGTTVDWDASWNDVTSVDEEDWATLISRVEQTLDSIRNFAGTFEGWDARYLGGAMAIIVHTAYHLGEIRTGIGVIREKRSRG